MEFKKVVEKDKDGNDVEVLKVVQSVETVKRERATSLDEQQALLDSLKAFKAREVARWDAKIAKQRDRILAAATALGEKIDESELDADPAPVVEEGSEPLMSGGVNLDEVKAKQDKK